MTSQWRNLSSPHTYIPCFRWWWWIRESRVSDRERPGVYCALKMSVSSVKKKIINPLLRSNALSRDYYCNCWFFRSGKSYSVMFRHSILFLFFYVRFGNGKSPYIHLAISPPLPPSKFYLWRCLQRNVLHCRLGIDGRYTWRQETAEQHHLRTPDVGSCP